MSEPTLTRRLRGARSTRRKDCQQCREPQIEKSDIFRRSTCRQSRNNTLKSLISYQASKIRVLVIGFYVNIVNGAYIQHHFFPDSTYTLSQISGRHGSGPELTGVSAFSSRALPDPNERLLVVWPAMEAHLQEVIRRRRNIQYLIHEVKMTQIARCSNF